MTTQRFELKAVGFRDAEGVVHTSVVEDWSDEVCLSGTGEDGEQYFFESEAYHLPAWCERYGFTGLLGEAEVDFELEEQ